MNLIWVFLISIVSLGIAFKAGEYQGYLQAENKVLKIYPPSEALEVACLGLWVGEQNKKAHEKWLNSK